MRLCMEVKKYRGQWVELFVDFLRIWYRPAERQAKLAMLRGNGGLVSDEHLELALMSDADPLLLVVNREFQNCLDQKNKILALQVLGELHAIGGINDEKFQLLNELTNAGKFDEVKLVLSENTEADSNNALKLPLLLYSEKWLEALLELDTLTSINNNDNPIFFLIRGFLLSKLEKYEESILNFDSAIKLIPENFQLWYLRGNSLGNLGRYEDAITSFDHVLEINPQYYQAWDKRGISLGHLGRYEESVTSFDRVLQLKPDYCDSLNNKGISLFKIGKYVEAISSFDKAISIEFHRYASWHDKGLALFLLGQYPEVLSTWKQAFNIIQQSTDRSYDVAKIIKEFIEELIPKFTQPAVKTMLTELVQTYIQTSVLTELGTALVRTLKQILAPDISDYTAQKWLALWQELLGDRPEMQLPFRLMTTAILYKQDPERKERLWLGLASEERSILDEALE
jgi:tetratricopeptide (TPR) repeat protein